MTEHVEVAVVGAGPAGMAAAGVLASQKISTLVLDEQFAPGGQIYRAMEAVAEGDPARLAALGPEYAYGQELVRAFRSNGCAFWPGSTVWQITPELDLWVSRDGTTHKITAERVILATGAMERPVPLAGWNTPGVMTVGALQILLKSSGMAVAGDLVLAGSGPLLYLFVAQCLALGIRPAALLETTTRTSYVRAARFLPKGLIGDGFSYLRKGLALRKAIHKSGIPIFRGCTEIHIDGTDAVQSITFSSGGATHTIPASVVALHEGVIPLQQLARQIGCKHVWDARQSCFRPELDDWGKSSANGVAVAGDGAGIGGARAAEHGGRLAAFEIARTLGKLTFEERDRLAARDRKDLARHLAIRPFLDRLYAPPPAITRPVGEIVVCRCEEVTADTVRTASAHRKASPDQLKRTLRCGMGPCQGRLCGPVISQLIADVRKCPLDDVGYYNVRAPLKPLSLLEIAAIDPEGYLE